MKKFFLAIICVSGFIQGQGQNWNPVGTGTNGFIVNAVELDSITHDIYIGGSFTQAGGQPARYVGMWNGIAFSQVGTDGADNPVRCLEIIDSSLWAGGDFNSIDSSTSLCISRWDGIKWNSVGFGFQKTGLHTAAPTVNAIKKFNGDIYAAGVFDFADSSSCLYISRWDGSAWNPLGNGITGTSWVYDLEVFNGELYVAGSFSGAGGVGNTANIAKWNGTSWSSVGGNANGPVYALHTHEGELYAAGGFTTIGGTPAGRVAKWNGFSWGAVGSGMNTDANSIASFEGDLYVGGIFTSAGGNSAERIAKWDGASWSALGSGANGLVFDLEADSALHLLYAAGTFTTAGGITVNHLAFWSSALSAPERDYFTPRMDIFPNPGNNLLNIRVEEGIVKVPAELIITDMVGKVVFQTHLSPATEWQVDASDWSKGVYFITLKGEDFSVSDKFMKQ